MMPEEIQDVLIRERRHAFVMPGGGAKAGVQLGQLNRCLELGVHPSMFVCTSGGTMNGIFGAMEKYDELNALWDETGKSAGKIIFDSYLCELRDGTVKANVEAIRGILSEGLNFGDKLGLITKKGQKKFLTKIINNAQGIDHLLDNTPLAERLLKYVRMEDVKIPFHCTLVSLYDGELYTLRYDQFKDSTNLALGALASTSIPGICKPVPRIELADGRVILDAVDGGLRSSSPFPQLMEMIDYDFDWVAWGLNCNSVKQQLNDRRKNLVTQAGASLDILMNDGFRKDMKTTEKFNKLALAEPEWARRNGIKYAKILNIEAPLDTDGTPLLGSTLDFRDEWIKKRKAIGYESVNMYFNQLAA